MSNSTPNPESQTLSIVLNAIDEGVILTDKDGCVQFINRVAGQLLGRRPRSAIGASITDIFTLLRPKDSKPVKFHLKRAADLSKGPTAYRQSILRSMDGTEYLIERNTTPIMEPDRTTVSGYVTIFRDITEEDILEQRAHRTETVEAIGNLAKSMSHDFNNILGIIYGYANTMSENLLPSSSLHDSAAMIMEAAEHGGNLTRRLLSVARAGDQDGETILEAVHLPHTVTNAINLLQGQFNDMGVSLKNRMPQEDLLVHVDSSQLMDTLVSIIFNALEATPETGTVTIDCSQEFIESPNTKLNPNAQPGDYIILRIRDTGHGIHKEHLQNLFDPFFSTHDSAAMGLGLTVAQTNVHRWGGWIMVRSRPEHGASFRLFIPKSTRRQSKTKVIEQPKPSSRHILLVESDNEEADRLQGILAGAGYQVTTRHSESDGLSYFNKAESKPDMIMLEFNVTHNGPGLIKAAVDSSQDIILLIMTGFSREFLRSRLPRGRWGFLQKPISEEQLLKIVNKRFTSETRIRKVSTPI